MHMAVGMTAEEEGVVRGEVEDLALGGAFGDAKLDGGRTWGKSGAFSAGGGVLEGKRFAQPGIETGERGIPHGLAPGIKGGALRGRGVAMKSARPCCVCSTAGSGAMTRHMREAFEAEFTPLPAGARVNPDGQTAFCCKATASDCDKDSCSR
jgi:hypothetical protein